MIDGRRRSAAGKEANVEVPSSLSRRIASVGGWLVAHKVTADQVTLVGVLLAALTAVVIGLGHLWIGVALITCGGLMDTFDGVVAKAAGTSSPRGAFTDSVADRVSDGFIFSGVAWHFLVGSDPKLAILPIAILAVSGVVSYTRAKAESLGFSAKGGMMERAERLILLSVALFFHLVTVALLIVLLVLTSATALGRFVRVWRTATSAPESKRPTVEDRWRTWREHSGTTRSARRQRGRELQPLASRLRGAIWVPEGAAAKRVRARARRQRTGAARRSFEAER